MKPGTHTLFEHLSLLDTEQRNPRTTGLDTASPLEIARMINDEDKTVAFAVERKLPQIANAIDVVAEAIKTGGRLLYMGSGTSGRIGVVDAAECPPTFGSHPDLVQGLIAGGSAAMFRAQEGAEDQQEQGISDLKFIQLSDKDVVCGLAASGRTPYVMGGLKYAQTVGAKTIFICCVPESQVVFEKKPDIIIDVSVGPEVLMGSTRMKSATAQKMICNMITTGAMVRLGKVYENVMVDLQLTNQKLVERAKRIVMLMADVSYDEANSLLEKAGGHVKTALIMALTGLSEQQSKQLLLEHNGFIKPALNHFK